MSASIGYLVAGIEPKGDPDWKRVGVRGQTAFWDVVGKAGLKAKDRSLAKSLDKNGKLLKAISQPTRIARKADINPVTGKGPYSIMGRAFGAAPPLMATGDMSRTRRWLRYEIRSDGVWFFWDHGWGIVLARHAKGFTQRFRFPFHGIGHVPPRDVIGISNADFATVKRLALQWWAENKHLFLPMPGVERINLRMIETPLGLLKLTTEEAVRMGVAHLPFQFTGKQVLGPPGGFRGLGPAMPPSVPFTPKPPIRPLAATIPLRPTGTSGQSPFFPHGPSRVPPTPHDALERVKRELVMAAAPPKPSPPKKPPTPKPPAKPLISPRPPEPEYTRPESITRAVEIAEAASVPIVPEGHALILEEFGEFKAFGVNAAYDWRTRSIRVNQKSSGWTDPSQHLADYRSGFKSTGNPDRVIEHEIGHALHHAAIGDKRFEHMRSLTFGPKEADVAGQVSGYARTSYAEFVAETYTGRLNGKVYSKEVMDLYAKFGGPKVTL